MNTDDLTEKQKRFCEEYNLCLKVSESEIKSGFSLLSVASTQYFVYFLINPQTEEIFYIGKGKGRRPYNHLTEAKNHSVSNIRKTQKINQIISNGNKILIKYFSVNNSEIDAFKIERSAINSIGLDKITNIQPGLIKQTDSDKAKFYLGRMLPFEMWKQRRNPPDYQIDIYWRMKDEFEKMIAA